MIINAFSHPDRIINKHQSHTEECPKMRIPKYLLHKLVRNAISLIGISKSRPVVISFTGGMGAQIISAAIYFDLKYQGYDVYADFRYFDEKPVTPKKYSTWDWQLDCYGLTTYSFKRYEIEKSKLISAMYVKDGPVKTQLASQAFEKKHVLDMFNNYNEKFTGEVASFLRHNPSLMSSYACVHLRRGDYLEVASYVVPEEHFLEVLCRVGELVSTLVVISDSPVSEKFKQGVNRDFSSTIFYDSGRLDFALSHYLMTTAQLLICSNSQFSWTAGKLAKGLVLIPNKWFGGKEQKTEVLLTRKSTFSVI